MSEESSKHKLLLKRLIKEHVIKYTKSFCIAIALMALVSSTTALMTWVIKPMMDGIFVNKDASMLKIIPFAIILIIAVKTVATYFQETIMNLTQNRILLDIQVRLYKHLIESDVAFVSRNSSGKLISRFTNDISLLRGCVSTLLTGLVREGLTLVFLLGLVFYYNFFLASLAFIVFPFILFPILALGRRMKKLSRETQGKLGEFTSMLDENFSAIKIIKAYQAEEIEYNRAKQIADKLKRLYKKSSKNKAAGSCIVEFFAGISMAIIVFYGGHQVISGQMTTGTFFMFIAAVLSAYKPAKALSKLNNVFQEGMASAERLYSVLDLKPYIVDKNNNNVLIKNGDIEFCNVGFSYFAGNNHYLLKDEITYPSGETCAMALKDVSFKIPKNTKVALVGRSGSGKSTIVNLIMRLYDSTSGNILLDGYNIKDISLSSLRDAISYVSQDTILFDDTVIHNVAYGKNSQNVTREMVIEACKMAEAHEFIMELENGYDTMIGPRGNKLSGGQKQRLSIARAIIKNAPILLLDEATSSLDSIAEAKINLAIDRLSQNKTTIVIAHKLYTIENSDMIIVMNNGSIVEVGHHSELITNEDSEYYKLYKAIE